MNRIRLILYILLAFGIINSIPSTYLSAQSGVQFREDYSLEKAIQVAQIENKNIFIDTYTPWCGPCKKMNFQFQDQELGRFLNSKYINIKINMESAYGPAVKNKYDVFFLPTLLILDKFGNVKYASEGAITSDELLALSVHFHNEVYNPSLVSADFATEEDTAIAANEETILKTQTQEEMVYPSAETVKSSSVADLALSKEEKILYTQDEMNDNPDFLYNLTYLKLQLQDGSHWSAAEKYLATQNDWSTKKNMKFIYL